MSDVNKGIQLGLATAKTPRLIIAVILLVLAGRTFNATAQTETILHTFLGSPTDGSSPNALVQGSDANFYGTTQRGGTNLCFCGTVFRISPSGSYTNLYIFGGSPTDGFQPHAGLAQGSDDNFYGTTFYGGNTNLNRGYGYGTAFRITPSGSYTSLYFFVGPPTDGSGPQAGLVQGSDGNFYGTTSSGGTSNYGTVFRISPSGSETNLHFFSYFPNDGVYPNALVQGTDGNFYGTTFEGGTSDRGTVFRISPSGRYTNLHSFAGYPTDGDYPSALVQSSDGNFYGTTSSGGGEHIE